MLIPILCILGLIILVIIILNVSVSVGMKVTLGRRGDGSVSIRYPLPSEQKNLVYKKDCFYNDKGNRFTVYEYQHKEVKKPKAVLLMIHGIGAGHFYLMSLINYFVKLGYLIVAYDQYASGASEGRKISSMTVGARDVKFALQYVDEKHGDLPLYVFGHSWGGFVASTALHYSKRIEKAVIVAGFNRMSDFLRGGNNPFTRFVGFLLSLIEIRNDSFAYKEVNKLSALDCFQKTNAKVLYLQGENDHVVNPEFSGRTFALLNKNPNLEIKFLENKEHTPFVTDESQKVQNIIFKDFPMLGGKLMPMDSYVDFAEVSKLDLNVCKLMSDFLEK